MVCCSEPGYRPSATGDSGEQWSDLYNRDMYSQMLGRQQASGREGGDSWNEQYDRWGKAGDAPRGPSRPRGSYPRGMAESTRFFGGANLDEEEERHDAEEEEAEEEEWVRRHQMRPGAGMVNKVIPEEDQEADTGSYVAHY